MENIFKEIIPDENSKFDENYKLTDPKLSRFPKHKQHLKKNKDPTFRYIKTNDKRRGRGEGEKKP